MVEIILVALLGIIVGFSGYTFFRMSITLLGGYAGYLLGNYAFDTLGKTLGLADNSNAYYVIVGIGIIALGGLAFTFYRKAIVAVTTVVVAYFFYRFYVASNPPSNAGAHIIIAGIGVALGFVVGMAALYIQKWAIILVTAIAGSELTASALAPVFMQIEPIHDFMIKIAEKALSVTVAKSKEQAVIMGLLVIILSIAGFITQAVNKK